METTKITVRIQPGLAAKFDADIKGCFIKRDAFLTQVLRNEVPYLRKELEGKKLSQAAKLHVSRSLKRLGPEPMNILIDKAVATALNEVVEETNIVRDAFMNFLLMFLRATPTMLKHFDLPTHYTGSAFNSHLDPTRVGPLQAISDAMVDPFYYLRVAVQERHGVGLYSLPLPENLHAFSVYIPDEDVPGTEEHNQMVKRGQELLASFERLEAEAFPGGTK